MNGEPGAPGWGACQWQRALKGECCFLAIPAIASPFRVTRVGHSWENAAQKSMTVPLRASDIFVSD